MFLPPGSSIVSLYQKTANDDIAHPGRPPALLGIVVMLLPVIGLAIASHVSAGVSFSTGEIVGPISGFALLGLPAIWAATAILRRLPRATGS